jgi:hypothetical protein
MKGMQMAKNVGLGINDFKKIIDGNFAFVDKTLMIKEFFQFGAEVTLTPRPRRFGKTMNLSMLRYFCEKPVPGSVEGTEQPNAYLFDGLKVSKFPEIMAHQGQYPVIFLTFKDIKVPTWAECYKGLTEVISKEHKRHDYLLKSECLATNEKKVFQALIDKTADQSDYSFSLKNLSEYLYRYYTKRVIILIDEYDTPIQEAAVKDFDKKSEEKEYYNSVIYLMRNLMSACLKDNAILHKGFVTGILRVSKESIFSGLNNLDVCSLTATGAEKNIEEGKFDNVLFTDKFGLLEEEIIALFQQVGAPLDLDLVKQWYNGYSSGPFRVYNPWSIVSYLKHRKVQTYWINTSDNKLPRTLVAAASDEIKAEIEQLRDGGMIRKTINESISFVDIQTQENVLWSFLLFTGYLTFQIPEHQEDANDFYLVAPNREIRDFLKTMVTSWFDVKHMQKILSPLLVSLASGNIKDFKAQFEDTVMRCFSYIDVDKNKAESFYHAFVLGMIVGLDKTHEIKSNRESGTGRYDVMIVPRDSKNIGIIIEFKKRRPKEEATLEEAAINALEQIEDKKYEVELRERGVKNIKKLAVVFDGKESLVKEAGEEKTST